ncbi:hypothetical protein MAR_023720, partial [Mya arenaria]
MGTCVICQEFSEIVHRSKPWAVNGGFLDIEAMCEFPEVTETFQAGDAKIIVSFASETWTFQSLTTDPGTQFEFVNKYTFQAPHTMNFQIRWSGDSPNVTETYPTSSTPPTTAAATTTTTTTKPTITTRPSDSCSGGGCSPMVYYNNTWPVSKDGQEGYLQAQMSCVLQAGRATQPGQGLIKVNLDRDIDFI